MELQAKQLKHNPKEFLMLIARIEIARRIMDKILVSLHLDLDLFVCTWIPKCQRTTQFDKTKKNCLTP